MLNFGTNDLVKHWADEFAAGRYMDSATWREFPDDKKDMLSYVFVCLLIEEIKSFEFSPVDFKKNYSAVFESLLKAGLFYILKKKQATDTVIKLIRDHGARVDWKDSEGKYPLDYVIENLCNEKLYTFMVKKRALVRNNTPEGFRIFESEQDEESRADCMIAYNAANLSRLSFLNEADQRIKAHLNPLSHLIVIAAKNNKTQLVKNVLDRFKHLPENEMQFLADGSFITGTVNEEDAKLPAITWAINSKNATMIEVLRKHGAKLDFQISTNLHAFDLIFLCKSELLDFQKCFLSLVSNLKTVDKFNLLNNFSDRNPQAFHDLSYFPLLVILVDLSWDQKYLLLNKKDASDRLYAFANQASRKEYLEKLVNPHILNVDFVITRTSSQGQTINTTIVRGADTVPHRVPSLEMLAFLTSYVDKPFERSNMERLSILKEKIVDIDQFKNDFDFCPIAHDIPNIPVKLGNQIYDFDALIKIECDDNGIRKNPITREPFTLSDIRSANDYQLRFDHFCMDLEKPEQTTSPLIFSGQVSKILKPDEEKPDSINKREGVSSKQP